MVEKSEIYSLGICSLIILLSSGFCFVIAWQIHNRTKDYITRECQVHSVNISNGRKYYVGTWSVRVMDNGKKLFDTIINKFLYAKSESAAWTRVLKYEQDELYECSGPPIEDHQTSNIYFGWQWSKPSRVTTVIFLVSGLLIFVLGSVWMVLYHIEEEKVKANRQNNNNRDVQTPLKDEEGEQPAISSSTSMPI